MKKETKEKLLQAGFTKVNKWGLTFDVQLQKALLGVLANDAAVTELR